MLRIHNIKIKVEEDSTSKLLEKIAKTLNLSKDSIEKLTIHKKSLDARNKSEIFYIYEVDIKVQNEEKLLKKYASSSIYKTPVEEYSFPKEKANIESPIIVGSGPAGLFAAYILAEHGYKPIIIEQGEKVEDRLKSIEHFFETGKLNPNSNVQFGEGGAGTFSDGKLNTLVKDKEFRGKKVFEIFVENGAPTEIMYLKNPHIGTDLLRTIIINMRNKILSLGATIYYNTKLTNLIIKDNTLEGIEVNNSEIIPCKNLLLAIGHSARDTFHMLNKNNVSMTSKAFAIGLRIEHPQDMINISQYGEKYAKLLPPASYKLTFQTKDNRGVYSFCMCPGGYVVNASSEEGHLAINGMSNHARDSKNANSALVVTITKDDFGDNPLSGIEFQRALEEKAYNLENGKIPTQLLKDFYANKKSTTLEEVEVITKGSYALSNLNDILPPYVSSSIKEAIPNFATKIKGYDRDDAILLGIESRTSSPVRIIRDENGMSNIKGLYPVGEGAGYAGGITTAAMDGLKIAEHLINNNY